MTREEQLQDLVSRWQRRSAAGEHLSPTELCQDCPDLIDELERRLAALERIGALAALPEGGTPLTRALDEEEPTLPPPEQAPIRLIRDLPGYEIGKLLGQGGMGAVYLARHVRLNRLVGLKILSTTGRGERNRFETEA